MTEQKTSQAVIGRLPRYYRFLGELKDRGVQRVSSQELSDMVKVTASQIRQDLNHFGGFGQQGYGYNVEFLYEEIGRILGIDHVHDLILIGAGHLGQALLNYADFHKRGFVFRCAFDVDTALCGRKIGEVPILSMQELEDYLHRHPIEIAVLTVPSKAAKTISGRLIQLGIRGIWNFAHVDLDVPQSLIVENVHLSDSLMKLSYNISQYEQEHRR